MNILIFMPRFLGDCINCTSAFSLLKQHFVDCQLHLVIAQGLTPLFEHTANVQCIADPRTNNKTAGTFTLRKQLAKQEFDACILMTNKMIDAVIAKTAGIKNIIGYATELRTPLLSQSLPFDRNRHYINRYAYLANLYCQNTFKKLPPVNLDFDVDKSTLNKSDTTNIGLSILSPAKTSRHYPVASTVQVIKQLVAQSPQQLAFYLFGSVDERTTADLVLSAAQQQGVNNISVLAGQQSIPELINDIAALDLLITADSGPLHIAAATQTKTVALHAKGNSPFSIVCPKGDHIKVVSSRGSYINDNDQVLDLLPEDVVLTALAQLNA